MEGEGPSRLRSERPTIHPDHLHYVQSELSRVQHEVAIYDNRKNARNALREQEARVRLALLQPLPEQLAQGQYEGLVTLLRDDTERTKGDIVYLQPQLQGKLEGDDGPNGYFALKEKILKADKIKIKLDDPEEQAFIAQLQTEWKAAQAQTERGRTLTSLNQSHTQLAHLQRLQQLLPQSASKA